MSNVEQGCIGRALTDLGNAERLVDQHAHELKFCHAWNKPIVWAGTRWRIDDSGAVRRMAMATARSIIAEASDESVSGQDEQKYIFAHAQSSQSRSRIEAMISLATALEPIPIRPESLDSDAWLLNTESGTVDLRTGELRPHDPGDLITKSTGCEYADGPGCEAPLWLDFLGTIFADDADMIGFVQRLLGVALIGEQLEHVLPIFHGSGANGKSVLLGAVQHALGEYAGTAAPGLFMTAKGERHPAELADLFGLRLVVLHETRDGSRLDEGLVKAVSGGDQIKARRMREDFWSFAPSHLPLLVSNHKPVVSGTDHGIWRRLRLVPFEVTIPPEEQDRQLPEKLRREASLILRWLVEGCLAWQRVGLAEPDRVKVATQDYRDESDTLGEFFQEWCDVNHRDSTLQAKASQLLYCYNEWAKKVHAREGSQRWLAQQLKQREFTKVTTREGVMWLGLRLREE